MYFKSFGKIRPVPNFCHRNLSLFQIAYILFLLMFTYTVLVKMNPSPELPEIYSICYILTFLCEKLREIITSEPVAIR